MAVPAAGVLQAAPRRTGAGAGTAASAAGLAEFPAGPTVGNEAGHSDTGVSLRAGSDEVRSDISVSPWAGAGGAAAGRRTAPGSAGEVPGGGTSAGRAGRRGIEARMADVRALVPNRYQPRGEISDGSLRGLADSIRQTGILQPITVRARGSGYEIVTGERRWRAAALAGLGEVPVVVREVNDEEMLELALIENIQRADLNPIERGEAYARYGTEFGRRPEEVARRVGEDRSTVANFLRLLELPEEVKGMVAKGVLSAGHGRCLLSESDPEKIRLLARAAVRHAMSVRQLEEVVRRGREQRDAGLGEGGRTVDGARQGPGDPRGWSRGGKSAHLRELEGRLSEACGTKVVLEEGRKKGSGRMVIEYYTLDDFDRIAGKLGLQVEN